MSKARALALLLNLTISTATAIVMLATEPRMAMVWDEPYTLGREERVRRWFQAMRDPVGFAARWKVPAAGAELMLPDTLSAPPRQKLTGRWNLVFDRRVVEWFWPFAREEPHGHPPFYALLGLIGDFLAPSWQDLPRDRLGPILLFSLTAGTIFQFVRGRWGIWAAILAAGAWVFQPNLFGHGHYASYDAPLSALWVLAILVFVTAVDPRNGRDPATIPWSLTLVFGVILGCAAATKLTGWFLPLPFLIWVGLYRHRPGWMMLGWGLLIALVVLYLLVPPWWTDPVTGIERFLRSNLTRATTNPIYVQFLGKVYLTPIDSLPWYNTLVWTVMVTPVGFLLMAGVGIDSAARRWRTEPTAVLIAGQWAFLMILRALPHTPGHDGVRLFLPAFGLLALLAGLGAKSLVDRWGRWAKAAIGAALLEGILSIALMMPVPLSYFSPIVGGLPGATALGMEPTYYWDALGPEARHWLRENTHPGQIIVFAWYTHSWLYLQRIGELPQGIYHIDQGQPTWYVLQNRPGAFSDAQRSLVAENRPAYTLTKLRVPLIWVFPFRDFERLEPRLRGHSSVP
jgi:4-amino-4-deoxy-L-arabinose transferase-like glycosyltransferase